MTHHSGHIIILRPDLDQLSFEALDHFQKHKDDYNELRQHFSFIDPNKYRGTGRTHFDGNPFYVDKGVLLAYPDTNTNSFDNLEARKLFAKYEDANTSIDTLDDLPFYSLQEMQNVFELIDNKQDYEILKISENIKTPSDKTIGFDIGYIGGDFFSAIADVAIRPMWHPPDFEDMEDVVQHLKCLNQFCLFDTYERAKAYRQTYLSKEWGEKEMSDGQITIIQIENV
jgi:hypothetical protein